MSDSTEEKRGRFSSLTQAVGRALRGGAPAADPAQPAQPRPNEAPPEKARSRTWDPEEWEEDKRYIEAMDLLAAHRKRDALHKLVQLHEDDPKHQLARQQVFELSLELDHKEQLEKHAEWMVGLYLQQHDAAAACNAYRAVRTASAELLFSERILVQVLIAADKVQSNRVVIDAASLLLRNYPESPALPRAFFATASAQQAEQRSDLAIVTLKNLVARFPLDPLAQLAERKLSELSR